jgi:hypothetical protein
MSFDLKWVFELLKLRAWQLFAIAAACGILLYLNNIQLLPTFDARVVQLCVAGLVIAGLLWLASLAAITTEYVQKQRAKRAAIKKRNLALSYAIGTLNHPIPCPPIQLSAKPPQRP